MCTVSFIPVGDHFILTSNRDEKLSRKKAISPVLVEENGGQLIYPKDAAAGGSWIGMKENGDAAVLLNGAFIAHRPHSSYRKSRGLIFLEILAAESSYTMAMNTALHNIEPFTLVLFESNTLYEFRWDGAQRYCQQLPAHRPHIWSSVTLYNEMATRKREHWFSAFLEQQPLPTQSAVLNFHRFSGDGDKKNDLLMQRDAVYSTVSITSIFLAEDRASMKYFDLADNSTSEIKINLLNRYICLKK